MPESYSSSSLLFVIRLGGYYLFTLPIYNSPNGSRYLITSCFTSTHLSFYITYLPVPYSNHQNFYPLAKEPIKTRCYTRGRSYTRTKSIQTISHSSLILFTMANYITRICSWEEFFETSIGRIIKCYGDTNPITYLNTVSPSISSLTRSRSGDRIEN